MVKLLKPGRVVVVTAGRFAGKKAVVLSAHDSTKDKTFGHAMVVGVRSPPRKVHKRMNKSRIEKRSRVKAFAKAINFNHLMPTRYSVSTDLDLAGMTEKMTSTRKHIDEQKREIKNLGNATKEVKSVEQELTTCRKALRKEMQKVFQEKFMNPTSAKTKKVSKDVLFLRKKLRF